MFLANFSENLMVCFLISYFKYSHFTWLSKMFSLKSSFKISNSFFFIWRKYSSFSIKLLLNFQQPQSLLYSPFLKHEIVTVKWLVWREARTSVFLMETCLELEIQKYSRHLWIKPETCFWPILYFLVLGFLILQMSHKPNFSLSSMNLATDFFFKVVSV